MNTRLIALLILTLCLAACSSNQPTTASAAAPAPAAAPAAAPKTAAIMETPVLPPPQAASSNDAVTAKLREIAGTGATDCGRPKTLAGPELQSATDCAMKAATEKKAFTVAYDMPGLTTGVAGNAQGKLTSLNASTDAAGTISASSIKTADCPAALRIAQSGRVTCFPTGSMGMGSSGANPHGGDNPHGANPHGTMPPAAPGTPNPHAAPQKPATPEKTR